MLYSPWMTVNAATLVLLALVSFVHHADTLFEDQVGALDWHIPIFGTPLSVDWIHNDSLMLIHAPHAVGAVNASTGELAWRYLEPRGHTLIESRTCSNALFAAWSTPRGILVQVMNPTSGSLESQVYLGSGGNTLHRNGSLIACGPNGMVAVLVDTNIFILKHNLSFPGTLQSKSLNVKLDIFAFKWHRSNLIALARDNENFVLFRTSIEKPPSITPISPLSTYRSLNFAGCSKNAWIVAESNHTIHFFLISELGKVTQIDSTVSLEIQLGKGIDEIVSIPGSCFVQFNTPAKTLVLYLYSDRQTVTYLGDRALRVALDSATRRLLLVYPSHIVSTDGTSTQTLFDLHKNEVEVRSAFFTPISENRVAVITQDGDLHAYFNSRRIWTRPESLNSIRQSFVFDYPNSKSMEVREGHSDIMSSWSARWYRHVEQLMQLSRSLSDLTILNNLTEQGFDQQFGFKKVLVLITAYNSLVAIDTNTGTIFWRLHLPSTISSARMIHPVGDTHSAYLSVSSVEDVKIVDPITGKFVVSSKFLPDPEQESLPKFKYRIRGTVIEGYARMAESKDYVSTYNTTLPGKRLAAISVPRVSTVASAGRVMGDRSVQYKVLDPNHIAMATKGDSDSLSVYLMDISHGRILGHFIKKDVDFTQPIHLLRFEHWTLAMYWNKGRLGPFGWTVTVIEMLQPDLGMASRAFSAPLPMLQMASFGLSIRDTISCVSVSITRNGATVPDILYMTSRSIGTLSRRFADGLRNSQVDVPDSGVVPISHLVPAGLDDRNVISHHRHVSGRQVVSIPTELESTSIVCSYGFDVFCTRILPSGAFDQLSDTFPKDSLVVTCTALLIGAAGMQRVLHRAKMALKWS